MARFFRTPDPGDIGDAADIHYRDGEFHLARKRGVKQRHQRRTLTSRRHIAAAEIADDVDAGFFGEQSAIANLPCQPLMRAVDNGLAVKADDTHFLAAHIGLFE